MTAGLLMVLVVSLVLYFLPTLIASNRNHNNTGAIFALNLLAGWSVIGYVGAFVWSLTNNVK